MELSLTLEPPPLTAHDDGSVRVGGSRVLLEVVIAAHTIWGWSAERIAREFDTTTLADIYGVLRYYHTHRAEVDAYLARRDAEGDAVKAKIEATQRPFPSRAELLARRAAQTPAKS